MTSNAGFIARDPAGATRRRRRRAPRRSSRSSISIVGARRGRRVERRLRGGDDERDARPAPRRAPAGTCRSCWRRRRWRRCGRRRRRPRRRGPRAITTARRRRRRSGGRCRSWTSSNAVSREPCSSGRVSSAVTDVRCPARAARARCRAPSPTRRRPARRRCSACGHASATPHSSSSRSAPRSASARLVAHVLLAQLDGLGDDRGGAARRAGRRHGRTAHDRFTAVGRAAAMRSASARTNAAARPSRSARWAARATANPPATPIAGAPRTARRRMASIIVSTSRTSSHTISWGRRVWSIRTAWSPRHSIVRIDADRRIAAVEVSAAREALHAACLRMVADGLVIGSAGNISVRVDEHHFVVSAAGIRYDRAGAGRPSRRRPPGRLVGRGRGRRRARSPSTPG